MTPAELKEYQSLKAQKANRKVQVKKYFSRRAIRLQVCEAYFMAHATKEEKANLENQLAKIA
jgi:hypothetical protein